MCIYIYICLLIPLSALAGIALLRGDGRLQFVRILIRCLLGCIDSEDVLTHYLCCPILWCLAREMSGISEAEVSIISRRSIRDPSKDKLVLLAFGHTIMVRLMTESALSFILMTISPACNVELLVWVVRSNICFRLADLLIFVWLPDCT